MLLVFRNRAQRHQAEVRILISLHLDESTYNIEGTLTEEVIVLRKNRSQISRPLTISIQLKQVAGLVRLHVRYVMKVDLVLGIPGHGRVALACSGSIRVFKVFIILQREGAPLWREWYALV